MGKNKCTKRARKLKENSGNVNTVCNQSSKHNTSALEQANKYYDNVVLVNQSTLIEAIIKALESISKRSMTQIDSIVNAGINGNFQWLEQICKILNNVINITIPNVIQLAHCAQEDFSKI